MVETSSMLPDPTADLHWSDYRGAIQDIFESNALKHPERLCVVETASSASPRREFTYAQINRASNVLAHHLVQRGVERSDVVTVYAHRGVDLPVAVMGILKAGATFSVIDPTYPPDRQVTFLDVARPRALIIIAKAVQEKGELSATVRSYINETLDIKTEIPTLLLDFQGTLLGGQSNGSDIFSEQLKEGDHSPGIVVGPDSTPTLSFTSGSEGRPKGVKGRHFSLAYYFDWMAETFALSEHDKFTMLSGIAHDPIQRDIFTPLYLGATILVPSGDDIQHELLAEWMKREAASVSHLTPAMGDILVGNASATFPALKRAFFVGDVLLKRQCSRLQELAPNVNIVNMYGTTETSRAVSYFEIPSRNLEPNYLESLGPRIPAGKGMKDVQLLVVDRSDRTRLCDVGEEGEIYVRAGGLAEGYLGEELAEMTSQKFVQNWFVSPQKWIDLDRQELSRKTKSEPWRQFYRGPRDRLYRSGDIGKYDSNGDVECTGRADNQVQIRGYRIELGEIDTDLSKHPIVRENVTLVRRDKDEEPVLVSYFVPDITKWQESIMIDKMTKSNGNISMAGLLKRFRPLCDDVKDHLRKSLPAYMIPSVLVPLLRMPLNPNGKVDKAVLPFPDSAELSAANAASKVSNSIANKSETEKALSEIWANRLQHHTIAEAIQPEDDFILNLGGDSALVNLMLYDVRKRWKGIVVNPQMYFRASTLRAFASAIDGTLDPSPNSENEEPSKASEDDNYAEDAAKMAQLLPESFRVPPEQVEPSDTITVLLTGASGFLGANILASLMSRKAPSIEVIVHIRASPEEAPNKLKRACRAYSTWSDSWLPRLRFITDDIDTPKFDAEEDQPKAGDSIMDKNRSLSWHQVANEADVVIHNAAKVHWLTPYTSLRNANVVSTMNCIALCATGKPKKFAFVSSTSVVDTPHYVEQSDRGIKLDEDDSLAGSSKGLGTGYGQSKWVSEYLVREAGRRGLRGTIIRPGYVLGHSKSGITNTDDFLVRMLKACIQLHSAPDISNTINMVPVDHVAKIVIASALFPPVSQLGVSQVSGNPRMTFRQYVSAMQTYGYDVAIVDYDTVWRQQIADYHGGYTSANAKDFPLIGLAEFVQGDLPSNTKAPELSDLNANTALSNDVESSSSESSTASCVTTELVGRYLSYLVAIGFLPSPPGTDSSRALPPADVSDAHREALGLIGGRGAQA